MQQLTATGKAIVAMLASDEDVIAMAKQSDIVTTRNDYAAYMSKLARLQTILGNIAPNLGGRTGLNLAAHALIDAGGNADGIRDALALSLGEALPSPLDAMLAGR